MTAAPPVVHRGKPRALTTEEAREILALYTQWLRTPTPAEISRRYGITCSTLKALYDGRTYKEIHKMAAINWIKRLGKWRTVFAGWQLGARSTEDAECQAVRDHREQSLAMRAEVSAIAALLVAKGVFTADEFTAQVQDECRLLCAALERKFPGFRATDYGVDIDVVIARDTTAGWRP